MAKHVRFAIALLAAMVSVTGCAPRRGTPAPAAASARQQIVPLVEYHQHIAGPTAVAYVAPEAPPPAVTLPADLAAVIAAREKASGSTTAGTLYTDDAQILDISEGEDHWARGPAALARVLQAYEPETRFVANAYGVDGSAAWIAGSVRSDGASDDLYFTFGLRKDASGRWRIAVEDVSQKPPLAFGVPITADRTIQVLDDAGIRRGVVLGLGYWFGDGSFKGTIDEEYAAVRAENDWTVAQVARFPDRLVAFCGVNPLRDYALREIARCAALPGVKGMKLHFANSRIDVKNPVHVAKLREFFRAADQAKLAIVCHLWTFDRSYGAGHSRIFLDSILPAAPHVVVQVAHMAGAGRYVYDDAMGVFADAVAAKDPRTSNLYFDLATVVTESISPETIEKLTHRLRQVGMERVLFGSDTPILNRPRPLQAWATLRRKLPLTDAELRTIAGNVAPYLR